MEESTLQEIIQDCFWNDYTVTAENLQTKMNNEMFRKFLFSKILQNSSHPSLHLRLLFTMEEVEALLTSLEKRFGQSKRTKLIRGNLFGQFDLLPAYQWRN